MCIGLKNLPWALKRQSTELQKKRLWHEKEWVWFRVVTSSDYWSTALNSCTDFLKYWKIPR